MKTKQLQNTDEFWTFANQSDWLEFKRIGTRDPTQEIQDFLVKHGYRLIERSIRSVKSLSQVVELDLLVQLEQRGYVFMSLLQLGDTPQHREKLYWLVRSAVEDDPGFEGEFESFAQFNEAIWSIYWNNANGVFIAVFDKEWVAMSGVHLDQIADNRTRTTLTGTVQAHRGLGLAQAVKILAMNAAHNQNIAYIHTSNDSRNTAMLAINKKLGFVQVGEFVWWAVV